MTDFTFGSRQILRFRVALLDSTGAPDPGASNGYVTGNPVSLVATPNVETGDEFTLKNGNGSICQYHKACDKIKRVDPVVNLCSMDPQLIALMTGGTILDSSDGNIGVMLPGLSDACPAPVCVEWWTVAQDGANQAVLSGSVLYIHFVIPKVTFIPAAQTYENGILTVTLNGIGDENPNITADGPFDDWPADLNDDAPDGLTSPMSYFFETTLPAAANTYVEVTSAAS